MKHAKECETETVGMMRIYGFKPPETKVLVYLSNGAEVSAEDIEKNIGLRQPEVNLAVNKFVKLGYVGITQEVKKAGRVVRLSITNLLFHSKISLKARPRKLHLMKLKFWKMQNC